MMADPDFEVMPGGTKKRMAELERILNNGVLVVEDFLPNIGQCALQDYGRLNDFMNESKAVLNENN